MSKLSFLSFHRSISKKGSTLPHHHAHSKEIRNRSFQPSTEDLKMVFHKFDSNGDGKISLDEYKKALKVLGGVTTKGEAAQVFRAADNDGDGFIDFEEFSKVCSTDGGVKSSEIQAAFRVFDGNGDGKISSEELMEVLRRMGERCSLEGCKKMIRQVDRDGDGLIDMDEFMNMMIMSYKP
ncbi:hypothetical protein Pfo_019418 [Paulownia fortunei]|nr:hypothetical protein Pfo_019418 [Paulownia fortunei]